MDDGLAPDEADAWERYRTMRFEVDAPVARDLEAATGLSMPDFDVLRAVGGSDERCVRVNALAAAMHWAASRLSRQLGRMERRGLIAREPCELDGRGDDVVLTDDGRRALRDARSAYADAVRTHFVERLTAEERESLARMSTALSDRPARRRTRA